MYLQGCRLPAADYCLRPADYLPPAGCGAGIARLAIPCGPVAFELSAVVPWGRSFDEYVAMFALRETDLTGALLGCGDGPASFNAEATRRGYKVTSVDPIYAFSGDEIAARIEATRAEIAAQLRDNATDFVWTHFRTPDDVVATRLGAMRTFLDDYSAGRGEQRYIEGALPHLPFADQAFDLALCSHFLFLYSAQHDAAFHRDAVLELCRVSREVRIFPIVELGSLPSRHLDVVTGELTTHGLVVERVRVQYEFQKGGNEMLRLQRPRPARAGSR